LNLTATTPPIARGDAATPATTRIHLTERQWRYAVGCAALLFVVAMAILSVCKHQNLWSDIDDLGYTIQAHWNTTQGRAWESSIEVQNNLGDHTTFIDVITIALYALVPRPETLLVLEPIIFSLGVIPVWRITKHYLNSPPLASLAALAYLAQPAAGFALSYEYHSLVFAPLLGLLMFDQAIHKRFGWAWLCFFLLLATREECGLTATGIGALLLLSTSCRKTGAGMTLLGTVAFFITLLIILPYFRGGGEQADTFVMRYSHFGDTPGQIVRTIITQPQTAAALLVEDVSRVTFIPILLAPWLMLGALCAGAWPGMLMTTLPGILSSSACQYTIGWHYPYNTLPIVTIAGILGLSKLLRRFPRLATPRGLTSLAVVWLVLLAGLNLDSALVRYRWTISYNDLRAELDTLRPLIPDEAALSATGKVGTQFCHRRQIAIYPITTWSAERFPQLPHRRATHVLINLNNLRLQPQHRVPDLALYELIGKTDSLRLYRLQDDTHTPTTQVEPLALKQPYRTPATSIDHDATPVMVSRRLATQ
jgi:uncharacterized membrane protein